jgi:hypothetical protein
MNQIGKDVVQLLPVGVTHESCPILLRLEHP